MPKKIRKITRPGVSRMLLTDTLPFELPLYYTNERLLTAVESGEKAHPLVRAVIEHPSETVPYTFDVGKAKSRSRKIALMHPAAQRNWLFFYEQYDSYISQLCSRSTYSLRAPSRPASRYFDTRFVDRTANRSDGPDMDAVGFKQQNSVASSYFAYTRYSHLYKFFNSAEFERLELNFGLMLQLDISKCFQSIYTHSITWAIRGKQFAKDNRHASYFEEKFDSLMRLSNWGETNGIVIGPEVSRIFAEVVLQAVDVRLTRLVGEDVEIRRYVDDYIIFGNDESVLDGVENCVREELQKFNLYLNDSKRILSHRPLLTPLTVARSEVVAYVDEFMEAIRSQVRVRAPRDGTASSRRNPASASETITRVRHSARRYSVGYGDLASSALAVIARHLNELADRSSADTSDSYEVEAHIFQTLLVDALRLSEFFYLMDIRAATSNKMARIFLEVSSIAKRANLGEDLLQMQVLDVTRKALALVKKVAFADILNVVVAADIVCQKRHKLTEEDLLRLLDVKSADDLSHCTDYLKLIAALYFSRSRRDMLEVLANAKKAAVTLLSSFGKKVLSRASDCMLLFDYLGCPHIPEAERVDLYISIAPRILGGHSPRRADAVSSVRRISKDLCFVSWDPDGCSLDRLRALLSKKELRPAYE